MKARYLGRDLLPPLGAGSLPAVAVARIDSALRLWSDLAELPRCAHLNSSRPADGVFACAAHPRSLLRCRPCLVAHGGRGRHGDYGSCVVCGDLPLAPAEEPDLRIDLGDLGAVRVVGLDLCARCREGA